MLLIPKTCVGHLQPRCSVPVFYRLFLFVPHFFLPSLFSPLSSLSVSLFLLSSLFILFACQSLSLSSTLSVCLSGTSFTIVVSYALFLSVSDMFVFLFVCLTLSRKSYNRAAGHTYLLWRLRFASLSVRRNPVLFRVVRKSRTQRNIAFVAQKQSASVSSIK